MELLRDDSLRFSATDLSTFISCHRATELDVECARGQREKPAYTDPYTEVIQRLGLEHEEAYIKHLQAEGKQVMTLREVEGEDHLERTVNAMKAGAEVIVQAKFDNGVWRGYADILYRVDLPDGETSKVGPWYYDVGDTKLAQDTKGGTMLQLCVYADLLEEIQGRPPEKLFVVKPGVNFEEEEYLYSNYSAYFRFMRNRFLEHVESTQGTYPLPVSHCSICRWWLHCDKQRRSDDHLSFVAGMQNSHVDEVEQQGAKTLAQFAQRETALASKPSKGSRATYERLHRQAQMQFDGRTKDQLLFELIEADEPNTGLQKLPVPSDGDVFFDIESDRFYKDGGLEYLLGLTYMESGQMQYKALWALNRQDEKRIFIELMDFLMDRWERYPDFNIYHFAPYEHAALKRLMLRHSVKAEELDQLLRAERFIDLHQIAKESIIASVEGYGLKDLEPLIGFERHTPLDDARKALRFLQTALELHGVDAIDEHTTAVVQSYNQEDCLGTEALRNWLELCREEYYLKYSPIDRPPLKSGKLKEDEDVDLHEKYAILFDALTRDLPIESDDYSEEDRAKWLLAHLLEYFNRENKNIYWEYYARVEMEPEDLLDDRKAIIGLEYVSSYTKGRERVPTHVFSFPAQEVSFKINGGVHVLDKDTAPKGLPESKFGTVREISLEERKIHIKTTNNTKDWRPLNVHEFSKVPNGKLEHALLEFAQQVVDHGVFQDGAVYDLLMGAPPRIAGLNGEVQSMGDDLQKAAIAAAMGMQNTVLPIQGPPGTGKTYTGAQMIIALAQAGKKIGVTAVGHKAIENLLQSIHKEAKKQGVQVPLLHKDSVEDDDKYPGIDYTNDNPEAVAAIETHVVGGTAWLWVREDVIDTLDYLFIDEAGQMSLAYVLAITRSAKNLVMLGDPQQLEQPQQAAHPEGADVSALSHYLGGRQTISGKRGLFLDTTWRLHPDICRFTSEMYYENRLIARDGLDKQILTGTSLLDGAGLFYVPVDHSGNRTSSTEEIDTIKHIIRSIFQSPASAPAWTHCDEGTKPLTKDDIMIVAPYNAQVAALQLALPGMHIGTVDKFQGQEAPIVIYSMASSSTEESPRGMSFLFDPHRLNVASSRARCAFIMVANPRLFEAECKTPRQMEWANGMCRFRELAVELRMDN